jgi:hypothetical protein
MRLAKFLACIALCSSNVAGAGQVASGAAATSTTAAPKVVPLYMSSRRIHVVLRVNGKGPIPVVFDTGANGNSLDFKAAAPLHLPHLGPNDGIDGATGKHVPGYKTVLKNASLSGVPILEAAHVFTIPLATRRASSLRTALPVGW